MVLLALRGTASALAEDGVRYESRLVKWTTAKCETRRGSKAKGSRNVVPNTFRGRQLEEPAVGWCSALCSRWRSAHAMGLGLGVIAETMARTART